MALELVVRKYGFPRGDELSARVAQAEAQWGHRQPTAHDLALAVLVGVLEDLPDSQAWRFRRSFVVWLIDATDMRDNGMLELEALIATLQAMAWTKFGFGSEEAEFVGDPFPKPYSDRVLH